MLGYWRLAYVLHDIEGAFGLTIDAMRAGSAAIAEIIEERREDG